MVRRMVRRINHNRVTRAAAHRTLHEAVSKETIAIERRTSYLLIMRGGDGVLGAGGESPNVTHAFQPSARLAASNSQ